MFYRMLLSVVMIIAWGISTVGLITILGYICNVPSLYTWNTNNGMAPSTGFGFIFTGFCLAVLTVTINKIYDQHKGF